MVACKDPSLRKQGHVDAQGICRVLLELAVDHFAEAGKDELIAWEFGSSSQLGEFIYRLAAEGSVELSSTDQQSDFDGWFDLNTDPQNWKLQW